METMAESSSIVTPKEKKNAAASTLLLDALYSTIPANAIYPVKAIIIAFGFIDPVPWPIKDENLLWKRFSLSWIRPFREAIMKLFVF